VKNGRLEEHNRRGSQPLPPAIESTLFASYYVKSSLEICQLDVKNTNSWGTTQIPVKD